MSRLLEMADAYEEADENDYCEDGICRGMRPDEIARAIIREIREQDKKTTTNDIIERLEGLDKVITKFVDELADRMDDGICHIYTEDLDELIKDIKNIKGE